MAANPTSVATPRPAPLKINAIMVGGITAIIEPKVGMKLRTKAIKPQTNARSTPIMKHAMKLKPMQKLI